MNGGTPYLVPWPAMHLPLPAHLSKLTGLPHMQPQQFTLPQFTHFTLPGGQVYPINQMTLPPTLFTQNMVTHLPKIIMPPTDSPGLLINGFPYPAKLAEKRKIIEEIAHNDVKKAKIETKALKAKRPGFTDDRYGETSYYVEAGLRKVYPYYFTFTTFTKGRWVGEKILDVFAREFRAHPVEEYERCILDGTLTVNYEQVDTEYRLRHNDLLANIVHRHETPVLSKPIELIHLSDELVVLDKPCSLPVHPCGRYRHNTVVFILAKEYNLKNLRTIHRLDRLTSGLLMFGRNPKKARELEQQIRNRQVMKEYVCRVDGEFPPGRTECCQPVEVVSYKIGVCKVSVHGKECRTEFERMNFNGKTSVVLCRPFTGRMHQIRVHLQYLGYPVMNDPLYNHTVFGAEKGKGGNIGKSDEKLISDLISIHNAENWLGMDGDSELSMFNKSDLADDPALGSSGCVVPVHSVHHNNFDPANPIGCIENNPLVPRNCTITRPPPITRPCRSPVVLRPPLEAAPISSLTYNDELLTKFGEYRYSPDKMTWDPNCYECKVRYRDPKAKDLVMYLHAWTYKGPDWQFQTRLPPWAEPNWEQPENEKK
ncbi:RNA pseudouridylate synthase domain-containing protein 2 isoform X2 [Eurytemora carolleeae]|uniref:RNA pseudouridylate synthase domain-containing protein 2 isoform X2 n=1 Tax=Eurytemora carolleeae TaxID=1294199 RepID=UPI000C794952|nr:RNA pseudouridylate synthase domain-containing protein 2 isoform X2 [Eurytemora carolleeae]|eukprot:XP_023340108.1 RNA pseudouridylate synthase domain-containing protein 2-like isoform X2 [Eurytemora affinis]